MKTIKFVLLVGSCAAGLAICLSGCSSTNAAKVLTALGKDPAAVHIRAVGMWGTVDVTRVGGGTNETRTISPDGTITIKAN